MKILVIGAARYTGMAVMYALTKEGHTFIGTDERQLPFNMHSRYTKPYYKHFPFSDERFYEDILSIIKKEKPDIILPVVGTRNISMHKERIKKYTNLLVPDYENFIAAYDKRKMHEICSEVGIAVPKRFTNSEAESFLSSGKNSYLVIKPDYDVGGALGLRYVHTINELEAAKLNIQNNFRNYIIEEFIPGASKMRSVQLVFDKVNKMIAYFILKKIHQWPITGGVTAYAESTHECELLEFVLPFFNKCPWEGPVEVELIIDERDGKPKLIEINPRFAGSISFAIQCGVNFPHIICMSAMNKNYFVNASKYDAGIFYINFSYYLKAVFKEFSFAKNKINFLYQVFKELIQRKVGVLPDKRDFPVYLAKAWMELKHHVI